MEGTMSKEKLTVDEYFEEWYAEYRNAFMRGIGVPNCASTPAVQKWLDGMNSTRMSGKETGEVANYVVDLLLKDAYTSSEEASDRFVNGFLAAMGVHAADGVSTNECGIPECKLEECFAQALAWARSTASRDIAAMSNELDLDDMPEPDDGWISRLMAANAFGDAPELDWDSDETPPEVPFAGPRVCCVCGIKEEYSEPVNGKLYCWNHDPRHQIGG